MCHPYDNIPSTVSSPIVSPSTQVPIKNKIELLKKYKYIIGMYSIEAEAIESYIRKHRIAWNIIYPFKEQTYIEPENFIKELNVLQKTITEMQYRYTIIEMFM
jgi:hypothetical protein